MFGGQPGLGQGQPHVGLVHRRLSRMTKLLAVQIGHAVVAEADFQALGLSSLAAQFEMMESLLQRHRNVVPEGLFLLGVIQGMAVNFQR